MMWGLMSFTTTFLILSGQLNATSTGSQERLDPGVNLWMLIQDLVCYLHNLPDKLGLLSLYFNRRYYHILNITKRSHFTAEPFR